jgi:hypothetical protein
MDARRLIVSPHRSLLPLEGGSALHNGRGRREQTAGSSEGVSCSGIRRHASRVPRSIWDASGGALLRLESCAGRCDLAHVDLRSLSAFHWLDVAFHVVGSCSELSVDADR